MIRLFYIGLFFIVMPCLVLLVGCQESVDPQILAVRNAHLLSESPGKPAKIAEARDVCEQGESFVIAGKVGVRDLNQWWVEGNCSFWITEAGEAIADHGGPGHDPATCPFCRRKWKQTVAVIQCLDENAEPISIDAKTLFDLKEGDFVTVKGQGHIDEAGILNVKTTGIHVR